ncbi:MAG: hypothetical protein WC843_00260 [Candidatus Gracilibacteria bacterium]|jgi:hypothetical protein
MGGKNKFPDRAPEMEKKAETPEQKAKRQEEIAKSIAVVKARVEAEMAFWAKVPQAGNDPETGIEAQYMVDEERTPEGHLIYKGSYYYSLGEGITVDGESFKGQLIHKEGEGYYYSLGGGIAVGGKSLTRVVPYTTSRDIDTGEAVRKVFSPDGEQYASKKDNYVLSRLSQGQNFNKYVGESLSFIDGEIGIRKYHPPGRGDAVYILDNNSRDRINVEGHTFKWVSSGIDACTGEVHRFEDAETRVNLIFTTGTHVEEFSGTTIREDAAKMIG